MAVIQIGVNMKYYNPPACCQKLNSFSSFIIIFIHLILINITALADAAADSLSVVKSSMVISDPFNGTSNPKRIPGAVVQYKIVISNAAGASTASNISILDSLDIEIGNKKTLALKTSVWGSNEIWIDHPSDADDGVLDALDGLTGDTFDSAGTTQNEVTADFGSSNANVLTVTGISLNASESATIKFQVTIVAADRLGPKINAITIPDTAHKVGDNVTATITVDSNKDDYSTGSGGISGTINGYSLVHLNKINNTTYEANFSITDGGTDIRNTSNIPVNFTLKDSFGNTSKIFTTPINQANDAIFANLPDIGLSANINTIAEDSGSSTLTGILSGSLNNQWPEAITVNLNYTGTATASIDYNKSDSFTIPALSNSGSTPISAIADPIFDAPVAETIIVEIDSLSAGNIGASIQQTLSITDAESAPTASLGVTNSSISENGGTSSFSVLLDNATYADVIVNLSYSGTATLGGVDSNTPSASIIINAGATSGNIETGITAINNSLLEGDKTIIIAICIWYLVFNIRWNTIIIFNNHDCLLLSAIFMSIAPIDTRYIYNNGLITID